MSSDAPSSGQAATYQFIGTWAGLEHTKLDRLVLDTNVAIDIERFYFGDARPTPELRDLLLSFANQRGWKTAVDVMYGWALTEATSDRVTGLRDALRYRRMRHALETVVDWDEEQISKQFASRRPPVTRDRAWPRSVPMPSEEDLLDPDVMTLSGYGVLLKTLMVASAARGLRGDAASRALREVVDWSRDVLGVMDTYAVQVAVDLLCGDAGRKRAAQRLLKHSGPTDPRRMQERASNAAWDLFFTRLCEGYTVGLLPGTAPGATNVVTRNVDLPYLRSIVELRTLIDFGGRIGPAPMTMMTSSLATHVDETTVTSILEGEFDAVDQFARMRRDPQAVAEQARTAVDDLERSLAAPSN